MGGRKEMSKTDKIVEFNIKYYSEFAQKYLDEDYEE